MRHQYRGVLAMVGRQLAINILCQYIGKSLTLAIRLQTQVLSKGIKLVRRQYTSINSVLADLPSTTLLINATGIGSLNLTDIKDTNLYPTRGQTWLVAEPKTPITRMYEFERTNKYGARFEPPPTASFTHRPLMEFFWSKS
jgi:D-amino-acid oxidase